MRANASGRPRPTRTSRETAHFLTYFGPPSAACNKSAPPSLSRGVLVTSQPPPKGTGAFMSRNKYNTSRRLGLESLEGRQLMAAVTASVNMTTGDLVVTGDDNANNIQIVQSMQN